MTELNCYRRRDSRVFHTVTGSWAWDAVTLCYRRRDSRVFHTVIGSWAWDAVTLCYRRRDSRVFHTVIGSWAWDAVTLCYRRRDSRVFHTVTGSWAWDAVTLCYRRRDSRVFHTITRGWTWGAVTLCRLFVDCLTSQQQISRGRSYLNNCTCCLTKIEVAVKLAALPWNRILTPDSQSRRWFCYAGRVVTRIPIVLSYWYDSTDELVSY